MEQGHASTGDAAQIRAIARQVAKTAIVELFDEHPELKRQESEIPAPLKWAGGVVAALFTIGIGAMAVWLVSSVSEMQVTLARMDERMALQADSQVVQIQALDGRVDQLETYHRNGS